MQNKDKQTETKKKDRKLNIICYSIAFVIAIILLWPQIMDIVENIQDLANVGVLGSQIDQAGSEADAWIDKLETVGGNGAADDAINDAGNAAENIGDILDGLKGQ